MKKKNEVLILKGLPASGKTTYAKKLVKEKEYKRINKDDLRAMIDNSKYSRDNENFIVEVRDMILDLALIHGHNVVVDDTNFNESHITQIKKIAKINECSVKTKFIDTDYKTCLERDKKRDAKVGEDVIMRMYKRYLAP